MTQTQKLYSTVTLSIFGAISLTMAILATGVGAVMGQTPNPLYLYIGSGLFALLFAGTTVFIAIKAGKENVGIWTLFVATGLLVAAAFQFPTVDWRLALITALPCLGLLIYKFKDTVGGWLTTSKDKIVGAYNFIKGHAVMSGFVFFLLLTVGLVIAAIIAWSMIPGYLAIFSLLIDAGFFIAHHWDRISTDLNKFAWITALALTPIFAIAAIVTGNPIFWQLAVLSFAIFLAFFVYRHRNSATVQSIWIWIKGHKGLLASIMFVGLFLYFVGPTIWENREAIFEFFQNEWKYALVFIGVPLLFVTGWLVYKNRAWFDNNPAKVQWVFWVLMAISVVLVVVFFKQHHFIAVGYSVLFAYLFQVIGYRFHKYAQIPTSETERRDGWKAKNAKFTPVFWVIFGGMFFLTLFAVYQ